MRIPAILALEDGSIFSGTAIGALGQTTGEVVFNTAMTGYEEIITDPSYAQQMVTFTYPHIGNTGINNEDAEASQAWVSGVIIRDLPLIPSNWRNQKPLDTYLKDNEIVAIADIDTRKLTRILRTKGAQNGCIMAGDVDETKALQAAQTFGGIQGLDLAKEVSVKTPYTWNDTTWDLVKGYQTKHHPLDSDNKPFHVVAYDYGIKHNIMRMLVDRGCTLTVVPAQTPAEDVLALAPNGIFLSNGPGDPQACDYAIAAIKTMLTTDIPIFGICLGYQLLALALGAQTEKMKFGHHGANHPVQDLASKVVMITSQNHGFAVAQPSLPDTLRPTHKSLFDGSLQGIEHIQKAAFGFQGHPEASPGPHDVAPLFDRFIQAMQAYKH